MKGERKNITALCALLSVVALMTAGLTSFSGCSKEDEGRGDAVTSESSAPSEGTLTVTVYAYCPCARCNTAKWKGMLATGQKMKDLLAEGKNICAADPKVIPMGATVTYDGKEYIVADTGRKIKGNRINILLKTHKEVEAFGVKKNQKISFEK